MTEIQVNFLEVLMEYSDNNQITYEGDVVFKLLEEGIVESFSEVKGKNYTGDIESLGESIEIKEVSDIKVLDESRGQGLSFIIEGKEYRYVSDKYGVNVLKIEFENLIEDNIPKGINWLRENSVNYYMNEGIEDLITPELEQKIEEWLEQSAEDDIKNIRLESVDNKGMKITVYENKEGKLHEEHPLIKEISEYVEGLEGDNLKWMYENDITRNGMDLWSTSFIAE